MKLKQVMFMKIFMGTICLITLFNFIDYPKDSKFFGLVNKKVIAIMKDEVIYIYIYEVIYIYSCILSWIFEGDGITS